ncbi:MAG TPA: cache domain-containing protein, partial [Candidatus Dormibacteraeota bacterium]|nr:cache domain-containing protein [Candidatus Dormibacteraeota bacterium]
MRRRLLLLAAAGLVPVVIMSGVGLYALARQQRTQAERIGLELARALATAVDAELRSSVSVLQSLATTVEIDPKNLTAFRQEVQPVLETQPTWAALFLADPSGHRLVDTRFPLDATLPTVFETVSFQRVVRTRAATVGGLARGADGVMLFAVRAPVLRAGRVEYVLTALVKPDGILNVITRQRVPRDWIISIFDANGLRVARSRSHAETLGGRASESLQTLMATSADEGVGQTTDLEGGRNYASFSRLGDYGWTVAPGIAAGFVEGGTYLSLAIYGSGILLSVVLGLLGAMAVAHSINRPMEEMRDMAKAVGRREPLPSLSTP